MELLNGMAGFCVVVFLFTLNNALIPTLSRMVMHYALLTTRLKLSMMTCNLDSSFGLGGLMAARNRLGSFSFKCWTHSTRFNYGFGSAFSSASSTFSLAFFSMCFNLSSVIFCTFVHISIACSSSYIFSMVATLKNPDLCPCLKNC
jgi:hypothetical protein